nr:uncharacterized protein LOC109172327 [Ipomoea trifida]
MSSQDLNLTLEKVTKTYRKRKRTTNTGPLKLKDHQTVLEKRDRREIKIEVNLIRALLLVRLQFKGQHIERKYPAISAWTVDMVQKRFADEKRSGAFGGGKVLDRVRKPVVDVENNETIRGKEKESNGVEVQVLVGDKAAMSDVEKISTEMKILAAAIVKFGKAMTEVGSKNTGKDIIKKTFSKMSDMLNIASTSQPAETSTLLDDDPIFNDESFLAAVSALEKAFIITTNPAEHPKEAELDGLPSSPRPSNSASFGCSARFVVTMNAFSNADTAARKLSSLKIGSSSNNVEVSAGWEVGATFSISDILLKVFLIMSFPVFLLPTSAIAFPNLTIAAANIIISVDIFSTSLIQLYHQLVPAPLPHRFLFPFLE